MPADSLIVTIRLGKPLPSRSNLEHSRWGRARLVAEQHEMIRAATTTRCRSCKVSWEPQWGDVYVPGKGSRMRKERRVLGDLPWCDCGIAPSEQVHMGEPVLLPDSCKVAGAQLDVLLVRVSPKPLDPDNVYGCFKATQDKLASIFRVDDRSPRIRYEVAQEVGPRPKYYAVRIIIGPRQNVMAPRMSLAVEHEEGRL